MNEMDRAAQPQSGERPPPRRVGGVFAVLTLIAVVTVIGMVTWWLGNKSERSERGEAREVSETQPAGAATAVPDATEAADVKPSKSRPVEPSTKRTADVDDRFLSLRRAMVEYHLRRRDITDQRVLDAMERIPRHLFVPEQQQESAYADHPLPIGKGQTISQPYIVALMTQLARPRPDGRALDVGTGSGYQAAVLSEVCKEVYSIEIVESLAEQAAERLERLGYENVHVQAGDGYRGWPEHAPFDLIIVAAAPDHVPEPLVEQLAPGGRMVIPVGRFHQDLIVIEKGTDGSVRQWSDVPVVFVPMTGEAQGSKRGRD